jgi:hypothetical protein
MRDYLLHVRRPFQADIVGRGDGKQHAPVSSLHGLLIITATLAPIIVTFILYKCLTVCKPGTKVITFLCNLPIFVIS